MCGVLGVEACGAGKAIFTVGLRGQSSYHAVQAGSLSKEHLRLDGWSMASSLLLHKLQNERLTRHGRFLRRSCDRGVGRLGEGCPRLLSRRGVFGALK